jgi:hypothetical protein
LKQLGWKTVRIWQHEFREPSILIRRLNNDLGQTRYSRRKRSRIVVTRKAKRDPA